MKSEVEAKVRRTLRRIDDGMNGLKDADGGVTAEIPWQERPTHSRDIVWRHSENPVIGRHHMPGVQGV